MHRVIYMSVSDMVASGAYAGKTEFPIWPVIGGSWEEVVAQQRLYREEQRSIEAQLRADLETEHGLIGHPKASLLWDMAWEDGHGYGYIEVVYLYDRLANLVKP